MYALRWIDVFECADAILNFSFSMVPSPPSRTFTLIFSYIKPCFHTNEKGQPYLLDGKTYDAFVSYLKACQPEHGEEHAFAVETLPRVLEKHFGYKLCIFERDVVPGGGKKGNTRYKTSGRGLPWPSSG